MEKGNLGIKVSVLAAIAFLIAYFSGIVWTVVFFAFILLTEKNEWLKKHAMQAVLFAAGFAVLDQVIYLLKTIPLMPSFLGNLIGYLNYPINIIEILFAFIAIVHVLRGEDANLPVFNDMTNKALDLAPETKDDTTTV